MILDEYWERGELEMYVKEVTVQNQVGLHARPATFFIQKANEFKSSIWVEKDERRVNAKSLLGVLSLGIVGGTDIRIIADTANHVRGTKTDGCVNNLAFDGNYLDNFRMLADALNNLIAELDRTAFELEAVLNALACHLDPLFLREFTADIFAILDADDDSIKLTQRTDKNV